MLIPLILSGGAGTRLWPVSRRSLPKPFMRMGDGESLLEKTLNRALAVASLGAPVVTITGRDYLFTTRAEYERVAPDEIDRLPILIEPSARNTAPAVLAAAAWVAERHGADATLLVLPADHLIRDLDAFKAAVVRAEALAAEDFLVTFGITPDRPETGFGYIEQGVAIGELGFVIERFVEKPDAVRAAEYLASGRFSWNSGMFAFRAGALLAAAEQTCPDVLGPVRRAATVAAPVDGIARLGANDFAEATEISFDYAVMERATRRAVVPAAFDWSDIGSWPAVATQERLDEAGNALTGDAFAIAARDCYVRADARAVAVLGLSDVMVIETGDAVLVAARDAAQDVKKVVDALRARGHAAADTHLTVHRPWGSYTVLEDAPDCKVKRLVVKPGHVLSLQKHHRRSEHWTVVRGTAKVRVGDEEKLLERNESVFIPMGSLHRLENPTADDIALIEVQCGDYFGEDDIVRLEDRYGRIV